MDSPHTREAYDERQAARKEKARQEHAELMATLACSDCGDVPRLETTTVYGLRGEQQWVRHPGGRCWDCHQQIQEHRKKQREAKAKARLEAAREANAKLRPCWTCRGSIGGKEGSRRELTQEAGPNRLECPHRAKTRRDKKLGPLVLPLPTLREQLAACRSLVILTSSKPTLEGPPGHVGGPPGNRGAGCSPRSAGGLVSVVLFCPLHWSGSLIG
ncbi:hypothetical protein ACIA8O_37285 [Kitasatospora sp. NPDC051853]|uniref:hypothetical protein n=1 Tax=Kitasatospora sp. NPDC051853 TaxID=3364058 RepID=UPI0037B444E4